MGARLVPEGPAPNLDLPFALVAAARGQTPAVGAEGEVVNRAGQTAQLLGLLLPPRQVPDFHLFPAGSGFGGAIWNDPGGVLTIRDGAFFANQAIGGVHGKLADTPFGSVGDGGSIFNAATLDVQDCCFDGNQSHGGAGLDGVAGGGGASAPIKSGGEDDDPPAVTTVLDCRFTNDVDVLYEGSGLDWFFAHLKGVNKDKVTGQTSGEMFTGI